MQHLHTLPKSELKAMCADDSKVSKSRREYLEILSMNGVDDSSRAPIFTNDWKDRVETPERREERSQPVAELYRPPDSHDDLTSLSVTDSLHQQIFVSRSLYAKSVQLSGQNLLQSVDVSIQTIDEMNAMVVDMNTSLNDFRFDASQRVYNNQFSVNADTQSEGPFQGHLHPGLILGKGFGVMEHLDGNYATVNDSNYWESLYLEFIVVSPSIAPSIDAINIEVSSQMYALSDTWYTLSRRSTNVGDVAFMLTVPVEHSKNLQVRVQHATIQGTPDYAVRANHDVMLSCLTTDTTVLFEMHPPPSATNVTERAVVHGDFVEWNCSVEFDSTRIGYPFDFEQLKLKLPHSSNIGLQGFNYYPTTALLRYTTDDDALRTVNCLAYIDSGEPGFVYVENTRLRSLKSLTLNIHAKYPFVPNEFPLFVSMRYDTPNHNQLTPLDVEHPSSLVFSNGEISWIYFNNRIDMTISLDMWQIAVWSSSDGDGPCLTLKLPQSATPTGTGKYMGTCIVAVEGQLETVNPMAYIETSTPGYLCIDSLDRVMSAFQTNNRSRLVRLKIQIEYVSGYVEFVRTPSTIQTNVVTTDRLLLNGFTFRNSVDVKKNVSTVQDNAQLTLVVYHQTNSPQPEAISRSVVTRPLMQFESVVRSSAQWLVRAVKNRGSVVVRSFVVTDLEVDTLRGSRRFLKYSSAFARTLTVKLVRTFDHVKLLSRPVPYRLFQTDSLAVVPVYNERYVVDSFVIKQRIVPLKHLTDSRLQPNTVLRIHTKSCQPVTLMICAKKCSFKSI